MVSKKDRQAAHGTRSVKGTGFMTVLRLMILVLFVCVSKHNALSQDVHPDQEGEWGTYQADNGHSFILARSVNDPKVLAFYDNGTKVLSPLHGTDSGECTPGCASVLRFREQEGKTSGLTVVSRGRHVFAPRMPIAISDLSFSVDQTVFKGRLWEPISPGRHPAVVLIGGTGKNLRDDFRIYPYLFVQAGYAVYAFDKRGCGESGGDPNVSHEGIDDLATDNLAAVAAIRKQPTIDPSKVGVLGISHGAWVAERVAERDTQVAFVIPIVGGGVPLWQATQFEVKNTLRRKGYSEADVQAGMAILGKVFKTLEANEAEKVPGIIKDAETSTWFKDTPLAPFSGAPDEVIVSVGRERWNNELGYDPYNTLAHLKVPILAISSEMDQSVPGPENLQRISGATKGSASTLLLNGASHYQFVEDTDDRQRYAADLPGTLFKWLTALK